MSRRSIQALLWLVAVVVAVLMWSRGVARAIAAEQAAVRLGAPVFAAQEAAGKAVTNAEQRDRLADELERMLQEAERQRQAAPEAPQLGAGLGARLSAFNPNISLIGDFLGQVSSGPDADYSAPLRHADLMAEDLDDFRVRGVELLATAAVDPFADALLKLHFSGGEVELEEAYLVLHDFSFHRTLEQLVGDGTVKIGLFRMALAPTNLTDDHDLPTVDRPLVLQQFLGPEGLIRPGVSYSRRLRTTGPWIREITVELTNGQPIEEADEAPIPVRGTDFPLALVRHQWYREWPAETAPLWNPACWLGPGEQTVTVAVNGVVTAEELSSGSTYSLLQSLDFMWTWVDARANAYREWLVQAELYAAETEHPTGGTRADVGGYVLLQRRLSRPWFVGLRFDATELPREDGYLIAASVHATYFLTEFNRFRFQYEWFRQDLQESGSDTAHTVWFQTVYAFGAHPPEPYYIRQRF